MKIHRGWVRALLPFNLRSADSRRTLDETLRLAVSRTDSAWLGLVEKELDAEKIAHSDYFEEYLPHVQSFLFGAVGATGCRYLKLKQDREPEPLAEKAEVWLKNLRRVKEKCRVPGQSGATSLRGLQLIGAISDDPVWNALPPFDSPKNCLPLHLSLEASSGMEIWVSQLGAGVLSISLVCEPADEGSSQDGSFFQALLQLNHALATAQQSVWLRPAGADNPGALAEGVSPPVSHSDPTGAAPWHLHQFVRDLVHPLRADETTQLWFSLRGVVYSAIEIQQPEQPSTDFQCELTEKLSHLAQVHPATHPGEGGIQHVQRLKINDRHLSFLSLSGAAHAAILPTDPSDYDRKRLFRIQRVALIPQQN